MIDFQTTSGGTTPACQTPRAHARRRLLGVVVGTTGRGTAPAEKGGQFLVTSDE